MARIRMKSPVMTTQNETLEKVFERFVIDRTAQGVSEKTLRTYRSHFRCISRHIDNSIVFSSITQDNIDKMVVSMRESGLSSSSIESYLRVLTTFVHWSECTHFRIPHYKAPETVKETYSDDELRLLTARPNANCTFSEFRSWVITNFLLNSGCRAATIRNIQNRDVDLDHFQVISRHNKNGKIQVIPLCKQMVSILREYQQVRKGNPADYLFCDSYGGQLSENALRCSMERYNKKRGVQSTGIHKFRHTFARKYLVDCGGNAFVLQKLLNHSTLKVTRHYCNIFDSDIANNYEQYSPLAQLTTDSRRKRIQRNK